MKTYKMKINGVKYKTKIEAYKGDFAIVNVNGVSVKVDIKREKEKHTPILVRTQKTDPTLSISTPKPTGIPQGGLAAPIPGVVNSIKVKVGDIVKPGDIILILEAMKMESEITATSGGEIKSIAVKEGAAVQEGDLLVEIG
jgi:glutaconyl-CoA/methylmalonyl-CoA decarboxylase subunit gamma